MLLPTAYILATRHCLARGKMESFVKWGKEKRQLDEVLGTALGVGAVVGGTVYLWNKGAERADAKNKWWVYKRDAEGDKKKAFDGISIVKMYHSGELKKDDFFIPPGLHPGGSTSFSGVCSSDRAISYKKTPCHLTRPHLVNKWSG